MVGRRYSVFSEDPSFINLFIKPNIYMCLGELVDSLGDVTLGFDDLNAGLVDLNVGLGDHSN